MMRKATDLVQERGRGGSKRPPGGSAFAIIVAMLLLLGPILSVPGTVRAYSGRGAGPSDNAIYAGTFGCSQTSVDLRKGSRHPCCGCENPQRSATVAVVRTAEPKHPHVGYTVCLPGSTVIAAIGSATEHRVAWNGPPQPGRAILLNTFRFRI